jgi:hypothetical protein
MVGLIVFSIASLLMRAQKGELLMQHIWNVLNRLMWLVLGIFIGYLVFSPMSPMAGMWNF